MLQYRAFQLTDDKFIVSICGAKGLEKYLNDLKSLLIFLFSQFYITLNIYNYLITFTNKKLKVLDIIQIYLESIYLAYHIMEKTY